MIEVQNLVKYHGPLKVLGGCHVTLLVEGPVAKYQRLGQLKPQSNVPF